MSSGTVRAALWTAVTLPAVYQLGLLITAIAARIGYPYDLEWMEGGMLHHALRIQSGEGIYVPPSIDFIPYLYTPLYPALLALLGGMFGISYTVGRVISVLALIGIAVVSAIQIAHRRHEHAGIAAPCAGVVLGLGLFAAAYPATDGWYDLVRADTLFLFMVTSAIAALPGWARAGAGIFGHARVAAAGVLLALAFFCKQTGIIYVALGGAIVLVYAWRRLPAYVVAAGAVGLGFTWLLQRTTGGWFWTYASEIHRAHDFNMDRFWKSFANILWQPELHGTRWAPLGAAISIVIVATLIVLGLTLWRHRRWPKQASPFALWTATYAVSVIVGAIGWGTEFAHYNAYMPAFLHGALAAGAAVPAMTAAVRILAEGRPHPEHAVFGAGFGVAAVLSGACVIGAWEPRRFTPSPEDVAAGDRLIERVKHTEGEVWMPSHPWYLKLAGKTPRVHRMGIRDVTWRQSRIVEGLEEALARRAFGTLFLDDADVHNREAIGLQRHYRLVFKLPRPGQCPGPCLDGSGEVCEPCGAPACAPAPCDERPRLYSGAKIQPDSIWMPAVPATPPAGARAVFDFERQTWDGWTSSGEAWGKGPVTAPVPGQELVVGATGARFATSMHGGDRATGRLTSPEFPIDGARMTMRLGGGTDAKIRVELWSVDAELDPYGARSPVATASVLLPGGDALREVTLDVSRFRGKPGQLVLIDDSERGHLVIDDVWLWP
ncbi:MAG TPA: hypothetical protein VK932_09360 [Kofleriaceae bacterium]|nr:hypothetical protein [Kofleriaceae bacterium]